MTWVDVAQLRRISAVFSVQGIHRDASADALMGRPKSEAAAAAKMAEPPAKKPKVGAGSMIAGEAAGFDPLQSGVVPVHQIAPRAATPGSSTSPPMALPVLPKRGHASSMAADVMKSLIPWTKVRRVRDLSMARIRWCRSPSPCRHAGEIARTFELAHTDTHTHVSRTSACMSESK